VTAKQRLRSHIVNDHRRIPAKSWTMKQMADWHAHEHWRYHQRHYHAGPNLGPDQRPPGWRTGEDAVPTTDHVPAQRWEP
jgi:hypothetical protein